MNTIVCRPILCSTSIIEEKLIERFCCYFISLLIIMLLLVMSLNLSSITEVPVSSEAPYSLKEFDPLLLALLILTA